MTTLQAFSRSKKVVTLAGPTALLQLQVPDADPTTGIFKITKLTANILVVVPKSAEMRNTDSLRLYWNGAPYGDALDLSDVDLTDPAITEFNLYLKVTDFPAKGTDVSVSLDYEVYDTASEDGQLSNLPVVVRFDQLAPGGDKLPPLSFTDDQLSGITVGDLEGGLLKITVEPFFDSAQDDVIELWVGTSPTSGGYLTPTFTVRDPTATNPVTIAEADLSALPPGPVYFGYRVTDWAGNVTQLSDLTLIPVFLNLPTLPAPLVPDNDDGLITYNDAVEPVGVVIPAFDGAAVGDSIYVIWNGVTLSPFPINDKDADPLATIAVPYTVVAQTPVKNDLPVSYWLQRTGTPRIDSPSTSVNVNLTTPGGPDPDPDPGTPEHENIKAPDIQCGTSPINTITPADYGANATATIHRAGEDVAVIWLVGDVIQLYWGAPPSGKPVGAPVPIIRTNEPSDITIAVPFVDIIEGSSGAVPVYFTVTRTLDGTNTVTVQSKVQTVTITSTGDLPGNGTLAAGDFWEKNASNIITRAVGIRGTSFRINLSGVSNIEVGKNPKVSYNFVGVSSGDAATPGTAPPIEASRQIDTNVPITQAMLTAGYLQVPLPYSLTYFICRNGAILDYTLSNDSGPIDAPRAFVRFAMNQGGGACTLP